MEFVQWHSPWCPTEVLKPNEYLRIYLGSDSSNSFVPAHQPTVWFKEKGERALVLFLLFGGWDGTQGLVHVMQVLHHSTLSIHIPN